MTESNGNGKAPRAVVYTTDFCGYCERAKALLKARGVDFREEYVERTPEGRKRLEDAVPGARSFPQIVIDGQPIGGYTDLIALDRRGGLVEEEG